MRVVAQQGNAPVAPADQILCRRLPGPEIVGIHIMEAFAGGMADDDGGHLLGRLNAVLRRQQHQPADVAAVHQLPDGLGRGLAALPRAQQHVMTAFRRRLPKALQHLGIEGMTQTFR